MALLTASDVSARIHSLIVVHERGDQHAAARRLGLEPRHVTGLLSGDWTRFSIDALAALVHSYGVSLSWLLAAPAEDARGERWQTHHAAAPRMKTLEPRAAEGIDRPVRA